MLWPTELLGQGTHHLIFPIPGYLKRSKKRGKIFRVKSLNDKVEVWPVTVWSRVGTLAELEKVQSQSTAAYITPNSELARTQQGFFQLLGSDWEIWEFPQYLGCSLRHIPVRKEKQCSWLGFGNSSCHPSLCKGWNGNGPMTLATAEAINSSLSTSCRPPPKPALSELRVRWPPATLKHSHMLPGITGLIMQGSSPIPEETKRHAIACFCFLSTF